MTVAPEKIPDSVDSEDSDHEDETRQVNFWRGRLDAAKKAPSFEKYKADKEGAYKFYFGEQMSKEEISEWGGDSVQANLFVRTINFMTDSVYNQDPAIRCPARAKTRANPNYQKWSAAVEHHLTYVFEEEEIGVEVRRTFKDSICSNLAVAEIDFDRERGLWRGKWVPGEFLFDPDAHGDLRRARWVAKQVQLPRYRVWQDKTFPEDVRKELKEKQASGFDNTVAYTNEEQDEIDKRVDVETLWYIYTKEGVSPLKNEDDTVQIRLMVCAEGFDRWLLNKEDPTPWLDADEYPFEICQIDDVPGHFRGPALWRRIEAVCKAFNWAASYHMEDMRKTATRPIGYDGNKIDDPAQLTSRKHMTPVECNGPPKDAVSPLNIGGADKTIFDSVNFWYDMLDKLTGVDEVARGEEGKTKTATESQILNQNSTIALSGPGKALDKFLNGLLRKIGLATLYYTPQFSVYMDEQGNVVTRHVAQVPQIDPLTQMPAMGPDGAPVMQEEIQVAPAQLTEEQAAEYDIEISPDGSVVPQPDKANQYLIKGIDYFHGDEVAKAWPVIPFEEIRCDLAFQIEAGSSRASRRLEKQRNAQALLQTVGAELRQLQLWPYYYECLNTVVESFELEDKDKLFPPKDEFIAAMQQQQMMAMQAMAMGGGQPGAPQGAPGAPGGADKKPFEESKNAGKSFPAGPTNGGN